MNRDERTGLEENESWLHAENTMKLISDLTEKAVKLGSAQHRELIYDVEKVRHKIDYLVAGAHIDAGEFCKPRDISGAFAPDQPAAPDEDARMTVSEANQLIGVSIPVHERDYDSVVQERALIIGLLERHGVLRHDDPPAPEPVDPVVVDRGDVEAMLDAMRYVSEFLQRKWGYDDIRERVNAALTRATES